MGDGGHVGPLSKQEQVVWCEGLGRKPGKETGQETGLSTWRGNARGSYKMLVVSAECNCTGLGHRTLAVSP